jgi:hypothetical protein
VLHVSPQIIRRPWRDTTKRERPLETLAVSASHVHPYRLDLAAPEQSDPELWTRTHEALCRTSLPYFAAEMMRGPKGPPCNGQFIVRPYHEEWARLVEAHDRLVIRAARDHGKTHFLNTAHILWRGGYAQPGEQIVLFAATQTLAEELLGLAIEELKHNPKLQILVPANGELGSCDELRLATGTRILARGMGVRTRGLHPQTIILDDALSDQDLYSATTRRRNVDYFLSAIENMIVPEGKIVVVGTPFHELDLYGHLASTGEYVVCDYPALDASGVALFPERYSAKRLARKRRTLGPARFGREFLLRTVTDDTSLFPSHLFEGPEVRQPYRLGMPASYWRNLGMTVYVGVDLALSAETGADFTVVFAIAVDGAGNRWIADIRRGRGWSFHKQIGIIKDVCVLNEPALVYIESNQMQRVFTDEIVRSSDIPVKAFHTSGVQPKVTNKRGMTSVTMGKHHLERGVPSLRIELENRKWRMPRGDENSIELTDLWQGELGALTWQDGKVVSVGNHDDLAMACWIADAAARSYGFRYAFGDEGETNLRTVPAIEAPQTPLALAATAAPHPIDPGTPRYNLAFDSVDALMRNPFGTGL